jgi:dihydropteroate synthase
MPSAKDYSPSSLHALQSVIGQRPPWIMGVVNVTPDSFSDGGLFGTDEQAVAYAQKLSKQNAQIIDIGGESTGPGRGAISAEEELSRIGKIVAAVASEHFVSVDTYKAHTAERCIGLGAQMVNDVSAFRADPEMAYVVKEHDVFVVLMHSKETGAHPHATSTPKEYTNVVEEVCSFLQERVEFALSCGIKQEKIILDPGMGGFLSPNPAYSWELLANLGKIKERFPGFALAIGTSRKGFLGGELSKRDPASQLTALGAHLKGADIIRTHNVKMAQEFYAIWQRIEGGGMGAQ